MNTKNTTRFTTAADVSSELNDAQEGPGAVRDWLTYAQAARFLNLSHNTLYWLVAERRVPHTRLGPRLVRFSRSALELWLATNAVRTASDAPSAR